MMETGNNVIFPYNPQTFFFSTPGNFNFQVPLYKNVVSVSVWGAGGEGGNSYGINQGGTDGVSSLFHAPSGTLIGFGGQGGGASAGGGAGGAASGGTTNIAGNAGDPGNISWNPNNINDGSIELWFDASNAGSLSLSGLNVLSWTDLKHNLVVSGSATKPQYNSNLLNGLPGISFSGSGCGFTATTGHASFNGPLTVFAIIDLTAASQWHTIFEALTTAPPGEPAFAFDNSPSPQKMAIFKTSLGESVSSSSIPVNTPALAEWIAPGVAGGGGASFNFGDQSTYAVTSLSTLGYVFYIGPYTLAQSATINSITMNIQGGGIGALAIYTSLGGVPGTLVAQTSQASLSAGFNTINTTTNPTLSPGAYFFAVVPVPASDSFGIFTQDPSTDGTQGWYQNVGGTTFPATAGATFGSNKNWAIYATLTAGGGSPSWGPVSVFINGLAGGAIPVFGGYSFTQTGIRIGSNADNAISLVGRIHELIILNVQVATSNRQLIEGYLAWKWGMQSNLPSNHPYFSIPPSASSGDSLGGGASHGGSSSSTDGKFPGGGGAGNSGGTGAGGGGYTQKSYNVGQLVVGSNIAFTVGSGGDGNETGYGGANGEIIITIDQGVGLAPLFIGTTHNATLNYSLTASNPASSAVGGVRSTTSHNSGKWYYEVTAGPAIVGYMGFGIANASGSLGNGTDTSQFLGVDNRGQVLFFGNPSQYWYADIDIDNVFPVAANQTVAVAVDIDGGGIQWKNITTNSFWDNNPLVDPSTGNDGASLVVPGPLFAALSLGGGGSLTVNFGATSFSGTVPTGYAPWGSATGLNPQDLQSPVVLSYNNSSQLLTVPAGTQNNDLMLAYIASQTQPTAPAGWTSVNLVHNGGPPNQTSQLWYKVASNEPSSYTWTNCNFPEGIIRTYRGANTATPINSSQVSSASGTSCSIPALTETVAPNEAYVAFWDNNGVTNNLIAPGDLGNVFTDNTQRAMLSGDKVVSGSTGQETATLAGLAQPWSAIGVSIKP